MTSYLSPFNHDSIDFINEMILRQHAAVRKTYAQAEKEEIELLELSLKDGVHKKKKGSCVCYHLPMYSQQDGKKQLEEDSLHIFIKQGHISNEGYIVWQTTAERLRKAQEFGLAKGETLISKVICAIGKEYRLKVAETYYEKENQYLSNMAGEKEAIAINTIKRLRMLEELERFINAQDPSGLFDAIERLVNGYAASWENLNTSHPVIAASIQKDKAHLEKLKGELKAKKQEELRSYCSGKLAVEVEELVSHAIDSACHENESKTLVHHSWTLSRGMLNDSFGSARQIIGEYRYPSDAPITKEQQLNFGDGEKKISISSKEVGADSQSAQKDFLLAIRCATTGFNAAELIKKEGTADAPKKTRAPNWRGIWVGPAGGWRRNWIKSRKINDAKLSSVNGLDHVVVMNMLPLVTQSHASSFGDGAVDILKRVPLALKDIGSSLWHRICIEGSAFKKDYKKPGSKQIGEKHPQGEKDPLLQRTGGKEEQFASEKGAEDFILEVEGVLNDMPGLQAAMNAEKQMEVVSPKPALPYKPIDLGTGLINGILAIFNYFKDEVHNKHPFIGALAFSVYMYCMLCFFPAYMPAMLQSKILMKIIRSIGEAMAAGKLSGGIAAGFTLYKLVFSLGNFAALGPRSWFYDIMSAFANNIGKIIPFMLMSELVGWTILKWVFIPWLTPTLQDDVGNIPEIEAFFAGLKLIVVAAELFARSEYGKSYFGQTVGDTVQNAILPLRLPAILNLFRSGPWAWKARYPKEIFLHGQNFLKIVSYNLLHVLSTMAEYTNIMVRSVAEVFNPFVVFSLKNISSLWNWAKEKVTGHSAETTSQKFSLADTWLNLKYKGANVLYDWTTGWALNLMKRGYKGLGQGHETIAERLGMESLQAKHERTLHSTTQILASQPKTSDIEDGYQQSASSVGSPSPATPPQAEFISRAPVMARLFGKCATDDQMVSAGPAEIKVC